MRKQPKLVLVLSESGPLQDGLLAVMTSMSSIGAILVAEENDSAMRMVQSHRPALIILDFTSFSMPHIVEQIKANWPQIPMIAIVDNAAEQKEAEGLHVDSVLYDGFSASKFAALVESIIGSLEERNTIQAETDEGTRESG